MAKVNNHTQLEAMSRFNGINWEPKFICKDRIFDTKKGTSQEGFNRRTIS